MRLTVSYYLFLLYSLVLFKPFIPVVLDRFSHVFAEAIHIATIHAKYGSNHLEKEVEKVNSENGGHHTTPKTEENTDVHITPIEPGNLIYIHTISKNYPDFKLLRREDILISMQAPPPKFS